MMRDDLKIIGKVPRPRTGAPCFKTFFSIGSTRTRVRHIGHSGYIFLITVLFLGIVAAGVTVSLLLLSTSALKTLGSVQDSSQALGLAQACADHALYELWSDVAGYDGGDLLTLNGGTCEVLLVTGSSNENRALCAEGIVGDTTRRLQIIVRRVLPSIQIESWQEVTDFTACTY